MTGTIICWIDRKKFGFILPDGSEQEVFVHWTDLPNKQALPEGTRVQFSLGVYGSRQKAVRVQLIGAVSEVAR